MKTKICKVLALILSLITCLNLCACACEHEWKEATCTEPKTCTLCGETEGTALGHDWKDATCTTPKTCTVCGKKEGNASSHKWKAATCTTPKTCTVCGKTEGNASSHKWKAATCTTPKTCTVCGETEGKVGEHTTRQGKCKTCGKFINKLSSQVKTIQSLKDDIEKRRATITLNACTLGTHNISYYINDINAITNDFIDIQEILLEYPDDFPALVNCFTGIIEVYIAFLEGYNSTYSDSTRRNIWYTFNLGWCDFMSVFYNAMQEYRE